MIRRATISRSLHLQLRFNENGNTRATTGSVGNTYSVEFECFEVKLMIIIRSLSSYAL